MNRGFKVAVAFVIVSLLSSNGCDDGGCCDDDNTNVIGTVLLNGMPVGGANVRIIFNGFIEGSEVTAADGTFNFEHWPEAWEPFLVEAFYIDPLTLFEYMGTTPFLSTQSSGSTNVGNIILMQTFPATWAGANNALGHLDGDGIEDLALASSNLVAVLFGSGRQHVVATASEDGGPFGPIAIQDVDGDGSMDLAVNRLDTGATEVWYGDGTGRFLKR